MEYKDIISNVVSISKKNENALMREAIEYIINKYVNKNQ